MDIPCSVVHQRFDLFRIHRKVSVARDAQNLAAVCTGTDRVHAERWWADDHPVAWGDHEAHGQIYDLVAPIA
jgi:hypothetical protein